MCSRWSFEQIQQVVWQDVGIAIFDLHSMPMSCFITCVKKHRLFDCQQNSLINLSLKINRSFVTILQRTLSKFLQISV